MAEHSRTDTIKDPCHSLHCSLRSSVVGTRSSKWFSSFGPCGGGLRSIDINKQTQIADINKLKL